MLAPIAEYPAEAKSRLRVQLLVINVLSLHGLPNALQRFDGLSKIGMFAFREFTFTNLALTNIIVNILIEDLSNARAHRCWSLFQYRVERRLGG